MRCLVVYSSRTGNTKSIAEAVSKVMDFDTEIYSVDNAPCPDDYDFIAVGYWVDKGTADAKAKKYLERIKGKKVALFGTLGANPESEHGVQCRENVKNLVWKDNQVIGDFLCRGKIDPAITERLKKLPEGHSHGMTEARLKTHMEAQNHPNEKDFENAQNTFQKIMEMVG